MKEMQVTGVELCDYLTWAYYNAIPLVGDIDRQEDYRTLATETCPQDYYDKITETVLSVSAANKNLVSSAFLTNLVNQVNLASVKQTGNAVELPLAFSNYQALNSDVLLAIASQSLADDVGQKTLPASSQLFFEIWADNTVHGFLNDVELTPVGCTVNTACTTEKFLAGLKAKIGLTDLEAACKVDTATAGDDTFI